MQIGAYNFRYALLHPAAATCAGYRVRETTDGVSAAAAQSVLLRLSPGRDQLPSRVEGRVPGIDRLLPDGVPGAGLGVVLGTLVRFRAGLVGDDGGDRGHGDDGVESRAGD